MNDLILVPTELELARLPHADHPSDDSARYALCGFGLVAAAARTMQLVQQYRPRRVWLVGIAGSLGDRLTVGAAAEFSAVAIEGIGVGWHDRFQPAAAIGWQHWPGDDDSAAIGDRLLLPTATEGDHHPQLLLSVAAASQDADHARWRQQHFPQAVAEDMEGFAVATACQLAAVPCRIIRGISNQAGDRTLKNWKIDAALAAAARLLKERITRDDRQ